MKFECNPSTAQVKRTAKSLRRCHHFGVTLCLMVLLFYVSQNWKFLLTVTELRLQVPQVNEEIPEIITGLPLEAKITVTPFPRRLEANNRNRTALIKGNSPSGTFRNSEQTFLVKDRTFLVDGAFSTHLNDRVAEANQTKLILVYNRPKWYFAADAHYKGIFRTCGGVRCQMTDNMSLLDQAAAVIVHVCVGSVLPPSRPRPRGQIWVAFDVEAPPMCSGLASGNWTGIFNWTMHYRTDSDIFTPYGAFSIRGRNTVRNYTATAVGKTKGVAWIVSNCLPRSGRDQYVRELQKHIEVDIYGRCGPLKCGNRCMAVLNASYHFYLAFENSHCQDYVTEKFFKVYRDVNVIPVVRGGADYGRYFPKGTYINTADFSSPKQLAEHLKSIMADPRKFAEMLSVKDRLYVHFTTITMAHCQLCRRLHRSDSGSKVYQDIRGWIRNTSMCWSPSDT